jgi:hypothetical protein
MLSYEDAGSAQAEQSSVIGRALKENTGQGRLDLIKK